MYEFKNFGFIKSWENYVLAALILVFCFGAKSSYAINYYFSSTGGNDAYTALQAQNSATPWKTLNKLTTITQVLKAGDAVYFKRGDIFEGSITVATSGIENLPIIFGAYGTGNKPVISGLQRLNNWKSVGNGIYENDWTRDGTQLIINNKQQAMGRYPNQGYLTYQSHTANTSITGNQLASSVNWTGAEVVIRKNRWIIDKSLITSHSGNTFNYATGTKDEPTNGYGYFIQKSKQTLDQIGEWYFDNARKKMMVFFGTQLPSSSVIRSSSINTLVSIKNFNYIRFENLAFVGASINAFQISNAKNVSIKNCAIDLTGHEAILGSYSPNLKIENLYINNSLCGAINLDLGCTKAIIFKSIINNTGLIAGLGKSGPGTYEAITSFGDDAVIEQNIINNTGYTGIYFGGNSSIAKNNYINNFCLIKDDGAGIYVGDWSRTFNKKIIGNIILNGIGNSSGTNQPASLQAEGIYIDDLSQSVSVIKNTVSQCANNGIKIHNAKDINIFGNLLYNNGVQLRLEQDHYLPTSTYIRNNHIKGNIFFSKDENQLAAKISSHQDDIVVFGVLDSNAYCRPFNDLATINATFVRNGAWMNQSYDVANWKTAFGKDASSTKSPLTIPAYKLSSTIGTNKFLNGKFDFDINGLYNYSISNDCDASLNYGVLDGGALKLNYNSPVDNHVTSNFLVGNIEAGKNYVLKFSALGIAKEQSAQLYLRKTGYPYTTISDNKFCKIGSTRNEHEFIFTATANDADASIIIEMDQPSGPLYIDNVSLMEATVIKTNPNDYFLFEYNAENYTKTIPLSKTYIDVNSRVYNNQIILEPYTSIALMVAEPAKAPQTIAFANVATPMIVNNLVAINPTASSGLPVTLKVLSGPAVITESNLVKFSAIGSAEIEATQKGDTKYEPVSSVTTIVNTGIVTASTDIDFVLKAYPNPFVKQLNLEFTMPYAGNGILMLYDMQGRMIAQIYKGSIQANETKAFKLDASSYNLIPGMYVVRLVTDKKALFQKVLHIQ